MYPEIQVFGICFPTFILVILIAVFVCVLFYTLSHNYAKHNQNNVLASVPFVLFSATITGRLFSALTLTLQNGDSLIRNLISGGNILYASVIGGVVCLFLVAKKRRDSIIDYSDVYATVVPLGQAIGRVGCYFNGCCYGIEYHGPLAIRYFVNGNETRVFPTWFAESIFCFILFIFLQQVIKRKNIRGQATSLFCVLYASFRFIIEFYRGDTIRGIWCGLSTSQYLSVIFLVFGIILLFKQANNHVLNVFYSSSRKQ